MREIIRRLRYHHESRFAIEQYRINRDFLIGSERR